MTISRVDLLMNQVRRNARVEKERFPDSMLTKLFNDAQTAIRSIIHTEDGSGKFFPRIFQADVTPEQRNYPLPADVYALNSINNVELQTDDQLFISGGKLRQVLASEEGVSNGYYLFGPEIRLTFQPGLVGTLLVDYSYKLPALSFRCGRIRDASGTTIRLNRNTASQENLAELDAGLSVVSSEGAILQSGLLLESYDARTGTITLEEAPATPPSVGGYVVLGNLASSHTSLPEEVIPLLTSMVERRVKAIDADVTFSIMDSLTQSEESFIRDLFSNSENDANHTPLSEDNYLPV